MPQNARLIVCTILMAIFAVSCKSKKALLVGEVDNSISAKKIIQNHYKNQLDFETLSGRVKIDYSNGESSQGFTVNLRMEKDSTIWISSSPLPLVKTIITPKRVSFYNKLEKEYFDGDFTYLSNLLGTEVDFEKVQNLLLGNAILDLREGKYSSDIIENNYSLKPKSANDLYKILFFLEPNNFKIANQQISQPWNNRFLKIEYSYQEVDSKAIPSAVAIEAITEDDANTIDLDFKGMEFGRKLNFPYKIPKGFKEIVLK